MMNLLPAVIRLAGNALIWVGCIPIMIGGILTIDGLIPKSRPVAFWFGLSAECRVGLVLIGAGGILIAFGRWVTRRQVHGNGVKKT